MKQEILNFILDIFFPKRCVGCKKFGQFLCSDCAKEIQYIKTSVCPECGRITDKGSICRNCRNRLKTKLKGVIVCTKYNEGPVKELIHGLKYDGLTGISEICGEIVFQHLETVNLKLDGFVIVPVPLFKQKEKMRGFNHATLIAKYIGKRLGLTVTESLIRKKNTKSQVGLPRAERKNNVVGAFALNSQHKPPKKVILVDDVLTTGATLCECANVLSGAGVSEVWAAVLAKNT